MKPPPLLVVLLRMNAIGTERGAQSRNAGARITKHRLLTNALAHDSPLVPDARERPPTEHEVRQHHTGQSDGELRRYYKADQVERRRRARRADLVVEASGRLAHGAGT